jgi:5-formyltetrahydrofolate cyclo-ligase
MLSRYFFPNQGMQHRFFSRPCGQGGRESLDPSVKKEAYRDKGEIRKGMIGLRNAIPRAERDAMSRAIQERLKEFEAIRSAATLMAYLGTGSEVDLDGLMAWGWTRGKRICVPFCRTESRELLACRIDDFGELIPGSYGIREPRVNSLRPVAVEEIDAILIPAAAFDRRGHRIGYGGGYYDRFLPRATRAAKIGVAFAFQVIEALPEEGHDRAVDAICTEKERIMPVFA